MSSAMVPDNPATKFDGDWYQRREAAVKTHGSKWRTQFTPEEIRFIEAAIDAECDWVQLDLPGPRRFGVMD